VDYGKHYSTRTTPQSQAIPGSGQVENSAGGYSWQVDDWTSLDRFLILGTEGGSYYASEKDLTYKAGDATRRCIEQDGIRVVKRVVEISDAGRAPKNDPAIFVLAMCAGLGNDQTRKAAFKAIPAVCRIGTHLFTFMEYVEKFRGWGRGLRTAVGEWYTEKSVDDVAYQMVKYKQRGNWSHRDVLRLCHPVIHDVTHSDMPRMNSLFRWAVGKKTEVELPQIVQAEQRMLECNTTKDVIGVLNWCKQYPWEAIPTKHLKEPKIWEALLPRLPYTAMIRNLGRMTANGALTVNNFSEVTDKLTNQDGLKKARIHPIQVLAAMMTYQSGQGMRGSLSWSPIRQIVDALDEAFYLSFGNVEPTGKRLMLAIDVSGSMDCGWGYDGTVAGVPGLTPRIGAAAMALITQRVENHCHLVAFSDGNAKSPIGGLAGRAQYGSRYTPMLDPITISSRQRLDDVVKMMQAMPFGGTDCALPMLAAEAAGIDIDTFVIYTDSETWAGNIHPSQALKQYREKTGIPAKLVVVGMVANEFSIADPRDAAMMDVIGFDTATPNIISDFAKS